MEISEQQLEKVVVELLRPGYTRFRRNPGSEKDPRLVKGVEILNNRGDWAISLFRNVHNVDNDVEIAVAPARIAPEGLAGPAMKWLESVRGELSHREHAPHKGPYKGEVFRIGLKLAEAQTFLRRLMDEMLKSPSKAPWSVSAPVPAAAAELAEVQLLPVDPEEQRARAIAHMVAMAFSARDQSGLERTSVAKDKQVRFASAEELRAHLDLLWKSERCALSGVWLDITGSDPERAPSLDRIDSDKHYEPENLQVVARFVNRWKSDDEQGNFVRLLGLIKDAPADG
ncbi:hypothetical protein [Hydrogenophaga sp. 2FB]|uniref:hypothetical protein n=1 Tax=Hydrogenophaga sp. 2FB TaxID=2502187 RepID=UPI0010F634D9|nr:hypothetical protein [Hydrogenophaga sp. 2FB]